MIKTIPAHILKILNILLEEGKEAYLVGGCVRDMIMKREVHDYDITSNAVPEELLTIFQKHHYSTIPTGLKHGTITILSNQQQVEITTYRIDKEYENHRSPNKVTFTSCLLEDLKRRDFTMNAIALSSDGVLLDPLHGINDIQHKLIRCVGDPNTRFQEDALRILRALRFCCVLKFHIDDKTWFAIQQQAHLLTHISKERIRSEFDTLLLGDKENTLTLLKDSNVLLYILKEYDKLYDYKQATPWHKYDIFTHTDIALNHTFGYPLESKLAIIFHDVGKPSCESFDEVGIAHYKKHAKVSEKLAIQQLSELKYDHKTIAKVAKLILYHDYYVNEKRSTLRRYLTKFDNNLQFSLQALDVQLADDLAKNLEKSQDKINIILRCKEILIQMDKEHDMLSMKDLVINGLKLQKMGFQGKEIGDMLKLMYDYVLEEPTRNTKDNLLSFIEEVCKKK